MGDAEEPEPLKERYQRAIANYETACAELNRILLNGRPPTSAEIEREQSARAELEAARRSYLEAWMQGSS